MSKWVLEQDPEMVPVPLDPKTYNQHLVEIAKVLYQYFCQLDPRFQPAVNPLAVTRVPNGISQQVRQ